MSSIAFCASLICPDLRNLPILFLMPSLPELVFDFAIPDFESGSATGGTAGGALSTGSPPPPCAVPQGRYPAQGPFRRCCVGRTLDGRRLGVPASCRGQHGRRSHLFRRGPDRSKMAAAGAYSVLGAGGVTVADGSTAGTAEVLLQLRPATHGAQVRAGGQDTGDAGRFRGQEADVSRYLHGGGGILASHGAGDPGRMLVSRVHSALGSGTVTVPDGSTA